MDATGTEIVGVQAGAAGALIEHHQLFTVLEAPDRRRQCADVHGLGRRVHDVRQDAADFREQHADQLTTLRHFEAQQLFDRQAEGVFLIHRRHVVETVEIRDILQVGARFHQLFGAAMQQANMRIDSFDHFTIEIEHKAQHTVRRGMLRAEIDRELAIIVALVHERLYTVCHRIKPLSVTLHSRPKPRPSPSHRRAAHIVRLPMATGSRTCDIPE